MLRFLDVLLTIVHLVIIVFNLFGWMFRKTRTIHLYSIALTALSWFLLGIWFGIGYCPITDWQWRVKEKLGESDLPDSFITYFMNNVTGYQLSDEFINIVTAVCFFAAAGIAVGIKVKQIGDRR